MRTKSLFGILLLFLLAIGFISCGDDYDDDKPERHLELSGNSCEVMQGYRVTIDLTAHENTTLEIENPELIDAVYMWEGDGYKAKIEIQGKQVGLTDIVVTDRETGESAAIKVKVTEFPMPRLGIKQPKGNIFDMMNFYLDTGSQSISFNNLSAVCDSIVWTVDGLNGSLKVFGYGKGDGWAEHHLTWTWGHSFKYPDDYKTSLTAWKDNKVIYRHHLFVSIMNDKDFLAYNWSDITNDSQAPKGYADALKSSPDLMTTCGLSGSVPYVEVRLFSEDLAQQYHTLYNYFCKLYSVPTYDDKADKQKMWQLYDELFSEQKKYPEAYPVSIWVAERANIVLLLMENSNGISRYVIYAEPNRQ